ncbi:MAG: hypothetical protein QG657_3250 [Acidobacteriota bacterium]|nr:hypothetical protein [Acidobacteriota bacterium]
MDKVNKIFPVYLGACSEYNPGSVASIIEQALSQIPLAKPISGKIVIKPNLVMAHPKVATESFTRKEVVEGILQVIRKQGQNIEKIDIVEKSGLGVTTATAFRHAGYKQLVRKYKVKLRAMEERRRSTVVLEKGQVHFHISIAREIAERDFLVFAPKLKTNVLSHSYSGALKLNIGTIDSKERIYHHNYHLPVKIVDILEAANPDLIVTDGIRLAFGGNQMTQQGIDMGVVVVSTNAVAHDMVCARLLGLDPFKIEHIVEAIRRGYGPASFDDIRIMGDFPIEKGQETCKKLDFGFFPVDRFPCNFDIRVGVPYCTGGCQGIFLDWLHMVRDRKPNRLKRFPRLTVLLGKVTGTGEAPVEARKVLLVGDCAAASRGIKTKKIVRIKGCPPSHKRIVWDMMVHFRLFAPLVLPSLIIDGFVLYPLKKIKGWLANLRYKSPD